MSKAFRPEKTVAAAPPLAPPLASTTIRLVATDGFFSFPGRRSWDPGPLATPDDGRIFGFGFRAVAPNETGSTGPGRIDRLIQKYKGKVTWPAPILPIDKDTQTFIVLTNLGLVGRPDLDDHCVEPQLLELGNEVPVLLFDGHPHG